MKSQELPRENQSPPKKCKSASENAEEVHATLSDDCNKLYCLFLKHTIPLFTIVNLELQKDEPMVQVLHEKMNNFLREILLKICQARNNQICT